MGEAQALVLTRPQAQSEAFAAAVEIRMPGRFAVTFAPLIGISPVDAPLDLDGLQGLVFTSANGVAAFVARSDTRALPAYCVGAMTAAAARAAGFRAESAGGDVADLAALVATERRAGAGAFLHVRGRHAAGDLAGRLASAGVEVRVAEIYDQVARTLGEPARALLAGERPVIVALFSPRTAGIFARAAAGLDLRRVTALAMSPAADAALEALGVGRRVVASAPTRDGMLDALAGIAGEAG